MPHKRDGCGEKRYIAVVLMSSTVSNAVSHSQLTYADFATYLLFEYVVTNIPGALEKYPTLAKLKKNIESLPRIASWIKRRPDTPL